jgi:peroxiredoxin
VNYQDEEHPYMRRIAIAAALLAIPFAASAHLQVGAKAPDFQTQGALAGKVMNVNLKQALKRGPVVLYFYPAANTRGCDAQAHEFSEASDDFKKAGATVIGMSADTIDVLQKYSVEKCGSKFAVATAQPAVIKAYDVGFGAPPAGMTPEMVAKLAARTNRTSYVIAPDGKVILVYSNLDYREHVAKTLEAVRQWQAQKGKKS